MKKNFIQAYKQAPWRTQLQWIGVFLLILVGVAAVAGLYLSITGRAAATGRRVQNLEGDLYDLQLEINDLNTRLAELSSARSLYERVGNLGMHFIQPEETLYIKVPGYKPPQTPILAPPPEVQDLDTPIILPEFTSSIWDWLRSKLQAEPPTDPEIIKSLEVEP